MSLKSVFCVCLCVMVLVPVASLSAAEDTYVGWGDAVMVAADTSMFSSDVNAAVDGSGNVFVVWCQPSEANFSVWVSRFIVGTGWQTPEMLAGNDSPSAYSPRVACDSVGNAFVVWYEDSTLRTGYDVYVMRYESGIGWGTAEAIETDFDGFHTEPSVAMSPEGNAVMAWSKNDGSFTSVWGAVYEAAVGWSAGVPLDDVDTLSTAYPDLGIDGDGNALVVWRQGPSTVATLCSAAYDHSTGWGAPVEVATSIYNGKPNLAMAQDGNATVVWSHWNITNSKYESWSANYVSDAGWSSPLCLYTYAYYSEYPTSVAVDRHGNALVMSERWPATGETSIIARVYISGTGWNPGYDPILAYAEYQFGYPLVAMNGAGETLVTFFAFLPSAPTTVWGMTFDFDAGWGMPEQTSPISLGNPAGHDVVIDSAGAGMSVATMSSGVTYDIWASQYMLPDVTSPAISISYPGDGAVVDSSTVTVEGSTEPGVTLVVNGIMVEVADDGSFSVELALLEGENEIVAVATDASDNSASDSITVTYDPPIDDIIQDLENLLQAALDELAALTPELNDTREDLTDSQEELADANERLDTLSSQVTLLTAAAIGAILLAALAIAMLVLQKRRGGESDKGLEDRETPPPPE